MCFRRIKTDPPKVEAVINNPTTSNIKGSSYVHHGLVFKFKKCTRLLYDYKDAVFFLTMLFTCVSDTLCVEVEIGISKC